MKPMNEVVVFVLCVSVTGIFETATSRLDLGAEGQQTGGSAEPEANNRIWKSLYVRKECITSSTGTSATMLMIERSLLAGIHHPARCLTSSTDGIYYCV